MEQPAFKKSVKQKKQKKLWVAVTILGAIIIAASFLNLGDNLVYFYTPAEAVAKAQELEDKVIRVGALVKKDSIKWNAEAITLDFTMTDLQGNDIQVTHKGPPPDLFKENQGVVAEGKILEKGHAFKATKLMVKHSEEYKAPSDSATSIDQKLLEKSIFKGEK